MNDLWQVLKMIWPRLKALSSNLISVCPQLLGESKDAAELHNDVQSAGETKHPLGSGPGTGSAELQPQHANQHGVNMHGELDVGVMETFAHTNEHILFLAWRSFLFIYWLEYKSWGADFHSAWGAWQQF